MPYPSLQDDGRVVTLDVHGTSIHEALDLVEAAVEAADARGRQQVKVIHGHSTSGGWGASIKTALYEMLEAGDLEPEVTSWWGGTGHVMLALRLGTRADPARLSLRDVW